MLKIAILSCNARAYSTRRLREACLKRGHRAKVLHTLRFSLLVESGKPALFFRNRKLSRYDAVIPRIGAPVSGFGTALVRQFEPMGVFSRNSSIALSSARDVILAETPKIAEAIIETLQSTRQEVVIPRFVSESRGRDIRAFVVGDRVAAAMSRQATGEECHAPAGPS